MLIRVPGACILEVKKPNAKDSIALVIGLLCAGPWGGKEYFFGTNFAILFH